MNEWTKEVSHESFVFTSSFNFHFFREVSHESFIVTSCTFTSFWRKSRTTASFSHLPLSLFEGRLARQFRSHILHFHFLREVSHESSVFISSTFTFWGKFRTKASFSHLPRSLFEEGLARNAFLKVRGCTKCCVLQEKMCPRRWMGKLVRLAGAEHVRFNWDHARIGRSLELTVQVSFC